MMSEKRGMLIVVLVVFLLVISSLGVFGEEDNINWNKQQAFIIGGDIDQCDDTIDEAHGGFFCTDCGYLDTTCDDGDGPPWPSEEEIPSSGCYFFSREKDDCGGTADDEDSYGTAALNPGFIFPSKYQSKKILTGIHEERSLHDGNEYKNVYRCSNTWRATTDYPWICSDNHYWHECNPNVKGEILKITPAGEEVPTTYVCLTYSRDSNRYDWYNTEDLGITDSDSDLVPNILDCAPDNGRIHGEFACRREEAAERTCITDEECADLVEGTCKPNGKCEQKVCVQTSATEICGDGIDNDCSEWDGTENYDYTQADDDCDLDQAACESNCLSVGKPCSWIDLDDGGICCGDDGINDIGLIQDGKADELEDDFVCLNQNQELVGSSAAGNNQK